MNLYTYVGNNPLTHIDPSGHKMEIDDSIKPLYNQGDRDNLKKYQNQFETATNNTQKQAAHDASNLIRLKYADSVTRIDFINGGSSSVQKGNNLVVTQSGSVVTQSYLKGEVSVSFIANASAQAKIQDNKFTISVSYGTNGKIGASATVTGGASVSNGGTITNSAYVGQSLQFPYLIVGEGKISYDIDDADWEGIIGAGLGLTAEIPIYNAEQGLQHETVLISIKFVSHTYPMTVADWNEYLGR